MVQGDVDHIARQEQIEYVRGYRKARQYGRIYRGIVHSDGSYRKVNLAFVDHVHPQVLVSFTSDKYRRIAPSDRIC
ncbi:hypothetical protein DSECCO2_453950 [anaerobic digester metagenome]